MTLDEALYLLKTNNYIGGRWDYVNEADDRHCGLGLNDHQYNALPRRYFAYMRVECSDHYGRTVEREGRTFQEAVEQLLPDLTTHTLIGDLEPICAEVNQRSVNNWGDQLRRFQLAAGLPV